MDMMGGPTGRIACMTLGIPRVVKQHCVGVFVEALAAFLV